MFNLFLQLLKSSVFHAVICSEVKTPSWNSKSRFPPFIFSVDNHKRINVLFVRRGNFVLSLEQYGQVTKDSLKINSAAPHLLGFALNKSLTQLFQF